MDGIASPFLSIIIPTLNSEKTLQVALDSVLQQTFTDFELCIIDSLSGDGTLSIVKENAQKDARIRLVSEKDKGIYDAMNKGIRLARGEWIFFLGSDDRLYDKEVIASMFKGGEVNDGAPGHPMPGPGGVLPGQGISRPADLLYGNVISTSYKGLYDGEFTFEKLLSRNISHQAIFYKKSLFDRIGNYNLRYRAHADWDLNIRCFSDSSIRVKYLDVVVAEFGADGISSQHDVPFLREVLIPEKLRMLANGGLRRLREIGAYDQWWRLIRNAGVRRIGELEGLAAGEKQAGGSTGVTGQSGKAMPGEPDEPGPAKKIPRSLKSMVRWQQPVPPKLLRVGAFSKSLMFASYLLNRLTGAI